MLGVDIIMWNIRFSLYSFSRLLYMFDFCNTQHYSKKRPYYLMYYYDYYYYYYYYYNYYYKVDF